MRRITIDPRPNTLKQVERIGFTISVDDDSIYYDETAAYELSKGEVDALASMTDEMNLRVIDAVEHVIEKDRFAELGIPLKAIPHIIRSWENDDLPLLGRFDFILNPEGQFKLLEFNGDTPSMALETAVLQWDWLRECHPGYTQFNFLHEALLEQFKYLLPQGEKIYFGYMDQSSEDLMHSEYLADIALQAGLKPFLIKLAEIGWSDVRKQFEDLEGERINFLYKICPWEWLLEDAFVEHINPDTLRIAEPAWKIAASSKGLLAILWELFPDHPGLVPAYFSSDPFMDKNFVRKPLLSREGANILIKSDKYGTHENTGPCGAEGYVYQQFIDSTEFDGFHTTLGSWIVGGESVGLGIREHPSLISSEINTKFAPHFYKDLTLKQ